MPEDPTALAANAGSVETILAGAALIAASGFPALAIRAERRGNAIATLIHAAGVVVALVGVARAFSSAVAPTLTFPLPIPLLHSNGRFTLGVDGLSAAFLVPLLVVPVLCALASVSEFVRPDHPRRAGRACVFSGVLAAALALLCIARDAIPFLVAWEAMALSAYFLIATDHEDAEVRRHSFVYLIATHVGTLALLLAFGRLGSAVGSFSLDAGAASALPMTTRTAVFACALFGFGIKAGLLPLHVWLPGAHASAPSHVSALLSGVVIKSGIYGLCRITSVLGDPPLLWGVSVLVLGVVSGVLGVAFALGQHDLKRLLAWHSIENIGIILMGLGLALVGRSLGNAPLVVLGLGACVLHVWNHALFKSLLFLAAGAVVHSCGTREIDRLGGLARRMPRTAVLFLIGAIAICGLPPLNGFVSEFLVLIASFRAAGASGASGCALAAPFLALIGGLAVACFSKVFGAVFLGAPRTSAAAAGHEPSRTALFAMGVIAILCVAIGTFPAAPARILDAAAASWLGVGGTGAIAPASLAAEVPLELLGAISGALVAGGVVTTLLLARRARSAQRPVTWDCGFSAPTPRMQYTASSFAAGLVALFGFALRPRERRPHASVPFPARSEFSSHVDDVVLERAILPACSAFSRLAQRLRVLHPARIQIALLYVFTGLIVLVVSLIAWRPLLERLAGFSGR